MPRASDLLSFVLLWTFLASNIRPLASSTTTAFPVSGSHHSLRRLAKQRWPSLLEKLGVPAARVPC